MISRIVKNVFVLITSKQRKLITPDAWKIQYKSKW